MLYDLHELLVLSLTSCLVGGPGDVPDLSQTTSCMVPTVSASQSSGCLKWLDR